jgi:hypothetical protein
MKVIRTKAAWLLAAILMICTVVLIRLNMQDPTMGVMTMATRASLAAVSTAIDNYTADCGSPPLASQGLTGLMTNPGIPNWHGPYIRDLPCDAWGTSFQHLKRNGRWRTVSAGPDRQFGTADDIEILAKK